MQMGEKFGRLREKIARNEAQLAPNSASSSSPNGGTEQHLRTWHG